MVLILSCSHLTVLGLSHLPQRDLTEYDVSVCPTPFYFLGVMDFEYSAYKSPIAESLTIQKMKRLSTRIQIQTGWK